MKLGLQPQMPAEHGGKSQLPIDLSASLNPLGPSPAAMLAARESDLTKYPEASAYVRPWRTQNRWWSAKVLAHMVRS